MGSSMAGPRGTRSGEKGAGKEEEADWGLGSTPLVCEEVDVPSPWR